MAKVVLPEPSKWNSSLVTRIIFDRVFKSTCMVAVPNCYWTGYEADLLLVEKGMRLIDVEVKISRSDLKADLKKDKWWQHPSWRSPGPSQLREWPPKIWKHYYVMPAKVWDDSLYAAIPPTSGVVLIKEYPHTKTKLLMEVKRRATPNRKAPKITPQEAFHVGRLCNLRMWDRIMTVEEQPRRLGTLTVASEYLRRVRAGEEPDAALVKMLEGTLTLDVSHDFMRDTTTYFLHCKEFDALARDEIPPSYKIVVEGGKARWAREDGAILSYNIQADA